MDKAIRFLKNVVQATERALGELPHSWQLSIGRCLGRRRESRLWRFITTASTTTLGRRPGRDPSMSKISVYLSAGTHIANGKPSAARYCPSAIHPLAIIPSRTSRDIVYR